ncbi:MAG: sulfatase [Opitutaceae bacterium]|nr:sulfatase [Opitutaceae bacterium]
MLDWLLKLEHMESFWLLPIKVIIFGMFTLGLTACVEVAGQSVSETSLGSRPNIILIFVDDLGYGDPGCYGGTLVPTPNMDSLAREGVQFTDGYVTAPLCAPSRSGLLSGAYQQRFGMQWNPDLGEGRYAVPDGHKLMPQALAEAGYTTGIVGKWNMPHKAADFFDEVSDEMHFVGNYFPEADGRYAGVDGVTPLPYAEWQHDWGPDLPSDEYLTDRLSRHAVDFVRRHRDKPFFLYLAYNAPHSPFQAKHEHNKQFKEINPEPLRLYAGMVAAIDEGMGQILKALRDEGLDERTLIAFVSDNGPDWADARYANWSEEWPNGILMGSAGPLAGNKAMFLEGGLRVPFILRWPGKIQAGQVYREPVMSFDLYPTFCAAAGTTVPPHTTCDGVDLLPYLDGSRLGSPHEILFWKADGMGAVRKGDWKLIVNPTEPLRQLFNLKEDIGETRDMAKEKPELLASLLAAYTKWTDTLPPPARQKVGIFLSAEEDIANRKKEVELKKRGQP